MFREHEIVLAALGKYTQDSEFHNHVYENCRSMTPESSHKCGSFCKWYLSRNIFIVCLSTADPSAILWFLKNLYYVAEYICLKHTLELAWENYKYNRQSPGEKQYLKARMVINSQVVMPRWSQLMLEKFVLHSQTCLSEAHNRVGLRKVQVESSKFWGETIMYKGLLTFSIVVAGQSHRWHYYYHYHYWTILAVLRKYMHPKP